MYYDKDGTGALLVVKRPGFYKASAQMVISLSPSDSLNLRENQFCCIG